MESRWRDVRYPDCCAQNDEWLARAEFTARMEDMRSSMEWITLHSVSRQAVTLHSHCAVHTVYTRGGNSPATWESLLYCVAKACYHGHVLTCTPGPGFCCAEIQASPGSMFPCFTHPFLLLHLTQSHVTYRTKPNHIYVSF